MNHHRLARVVAVTAAAFTAIASPILASAGNVSYTLSPATRVSTCSGQNAEVEQATDPARGYVYEDWMAAGCHNIAFSRSTDGGRTFSAPIGLPGSPGSTVNAWDPALTVGSDGTVYAAFMIAKNGGWFPVVATSFDHGATFEQVAYLQPPDPKNWGDRDFLAVDPTSPNIVYLTYDYGPNRTSVTFLCAANGSCGFATGDLNVVLQKSTDYGKTWSAQFHVSPGFPASGGDSAPLIVEPNHRIDLLYQGYKITNTTTYAMDPGHEFYTSSTTGGAKWSPPVEIGPDTLNLSMSLAEWWIDGALAVDARGTLYASWDSQDSVGNKDTGWLSYSTDHGQTWSPLIQVTDTVNVAHIMEVTAGPAGTVYVSWLSTASPTTNALTAGYSQYLRPYAIGTGWLTPPIQVSGSIYGDPNTWPGDTTGLSTLASNQVVLSWGSGVITNNQPKSEIFSAVVTFK
jgi:BNR/Asp-box repeat